MGDSLCYLEEDKIASYLDRPEVRDVLGVPSNIGNFSGCSDIVGSNFNKHMDKWRLPAQLYVAELLERGIPILLYAGKSPSETKPVIGQITHFEHWKRLKIMNDTLGTYDWQCNWVSNFEWSDELEWSGGKEFREQTMRDWSVPGSQIVAGQTRSARNLTMTTIYGAGHMARYFLFSFREHDIIILF